MTTLDIRLRELRDGGRKALVPYFVGGLDDEWLECVKAAAFAGADAIEIGVPFSDPIMDGKVIQEASLRALGRGTTLTSVLEGLHTLDIDVPLIVMTYFNIFHHHGLERSAIELHEAGVLGTIVPDLSLEEIAPWRTVSNEHDVASILMTALSTPPERAMQLAAETQGFAYAAARMAVTGVASDEGRGDLVVEKLRQASTVPIYVGIGITTPEQAAAACAFADGAIVGSALVQRLLDGEGPKGVEQFLGEMRSAINAVGR